MPKFLCNKLGRDKTLDGFRAQDISTDHEVLSGHELLRALKLKLLEEAEEVHDTGTQQELLEELADVLEVVAGICKTSNIDEQELARVRKKKYEQRGGFEHGVYVKCIEMSEENPRITYFRASPDKYPEK